MFSVKKYLALISSKNIQILDIIQCLPINWITLGQVESDNIYRPIQLTDVCVITKQKKIDTLYKNLVFEFSKILINRQLFEAKKTS